MISNKSILFCHFTSDIYGGSDRSLYDLVLKIKKHDSYKVVVVLKKNDPMAKKYRENGIDIKELNLYSAVRNGSLIQYVKYFINLPISALRIAGIIVLNKVDIVHVNTSYNFQGMLAAKLCFRPLLWHVREIGKPNKIDATIRKIICAFSTRIIAISEAVREQFAGCREKVILIKNGIDLTEYENLANKSPNDYDNKNKVSPNTVTCIGRIEPWKGQHVLVKAIPYILADYPGTIFKFVGECANNKKEYCEQLKLQCKELGIIKNVEFTGIRHDIPMILQDSDILVLPSILPEPFGRTIVESMAAACPVIATDIGGPSEIISHNKTGWLVEPGNHEELADKIKEVLSNNNYQIVESAKKEAFSRYSMDRVQSEFIALLNDA